MGGVQHATADVEAFTGEGFGFRESGDVQHDLRQTAEALGDERVIVSQQPTLLGQGWRHRR